MFAGELVEEGAHGPAFPATRLFKSTADASNRFEQVLVVEKLLVGCCALDHDLGLAVYREDSGLPGFFKLANHILSVSLKFAQGVDVGKIQTHTMNLHEICMP